MNTIRHVVFRGLVQGVGFRAFVEDRALSGGVEGWVRNRRDGTVEAVFAGAAQQVEAVIEACRRGPRQGCVDSIATRDGSLEDLAPRGVQSFAVLPTV